MRTLLVMFLAVFGSFAAGCGCGDDDDTALDAGPDDGGDGEDAGRIPGREVRVPSVVETDVGALVEIEATIVAGEEPWATTFTAEAPHFDYIEGQAAFAGALAIDSVRLEAGQQKAYRLRLQTLLTWDHTITLRVHGEPYEVTVHPRLAFPLIGVQGFGCDGPHELAYGPDCGPCGLETTSAVCAGSQPLETCHPVGFRIPEGVDESVARAACDVGAALSSQFTQSVPASWASLALDPATLDLNELTWVSGVMEEQRRTRPLPTPGYGTWWMQTCPDCANADGSRGAYDPTNTAVFNGLEVMGQTLGGLRGLAGLQVAELGATLEHLCPCLATGSPCDAPSGPSQAACVAPEGLRSEEMGAAYGPLLAAIDARIATGVHRSAPDAVVISAPVDDPNLGLSPLTRVALINGLDDSIDAIGVTSSPLPPPTWLDPMPNCALAEPGCETAPPFTDWVAALPEPTDVSAAATWRALDQALDPAEMAVGLRLGGWERVPMWVSSLRAGFHGTSPREAIAALRAAAIFTSAGVRGMAFAFPPVNPEVYEVLTRTFSGVTPVTRPETTATYDEHVVRFFTRPGQDVMVLWNNSDTARVAFVSSIDGEYLGASLTTVRAGGPQVELTTETFETPDVQIDLAPLSDFAILTVDAEENLGFDWLETFQI